jgi:amino acid adenylation domain-containing protein
MDRRSHSEWPEGPGLGTDVSPPAWRELNRTEHAFPSDRPVCRLFESQVERTPDTPAVCCRDETLTYRALNARANRLARRLEKLGVRPGERVALCVDRSPDMMVALYGILKAGGAYVPLDPVYPRDRLAHMLRDSSAAVLLTQEHLAANLPAHDACVVRIDRDRELIGAEDTPNLPSAPGPEDLIYTIYTSGSTGKPKGVSIRHRGFTNLACWYADEFRFGLRSRILVMSSLSFDLTQKNLYAPLLTGARVVLLETQHYDAHVIRETIRRHGITALNCTPSAFLGLLSPLTEDVCRQLASVEKVFLGGEPISMPRLRPWLENPLCNAVVVNTYGPTECTDVCAFHVLRDAARYEASAVPIGRPIWNTQLYILDDNLSPVPPGREGELCIGGAGVGAGYLNRDDLNAERFVPDPFVATAGAGLYRSGDRARLSDAGDIEFLGRADHQVKIRGFRVELGEVEAGLEGHPRVKQAVVTAVGGGPDDTTLAAYIVARGDGRPSISDLRSVLQRSVPDYMLPTAWVFLDAVPLTPNGKVDRQALPDPEKKRPELNQPYAAPRDVLQRLLADLWAELLGLDRVGIHDPFFEIGGNSIRAIAFINRLGQELGVPVPIVALFGAPTIAAFSDALRRRFPDAVAARTGSAPPGTEDGTFAGPSDRAERRAAKRRRSADADEPLAIVGMACRFPGADDIDAFWANLRDGVESIVDVSAQDLEACGVDPRVMDEPDYVPRAAPLREAECFDAEFFGMTPREAQLMDPQHRMFLECAWSALEHAGYDPERCGARVGVFGGIARDAYLVRNLVTHPGLRNAAGEYYVLLPNEKDFPATRVAYKLNLRGPAINIQTACSSSGVALHVARGSLLSGESDMALVGGCRVIVPTRAGYRYIEGGTLSPDGHVRAFDAEARGMVRGSGVGFLVLKRLSDARADGDTIHALVRGTAVNNDGAAKAGFTAPSVEGQAAAIREAQEAAGVSADAITYIEAHGTGTAIGDPIEIAGLTQAFRATTDRTGYCAVGSVKTNIGHLDAGACVAGIIKTALALKHARIPPSLNFTRPNPHIDFDNSPFYVNAALREWTAPGPRLAGVSSFGLGGTNAHVILEEAPGAGEPAPARPQQLLLLSARNANALESAGERLAAHLDSLPGGELADAAYTLQAGRREFSHRRVLVADTPSRAAEALRNGRAAPVKTRMFEGDIPDVVFMFPGQGAQHVDMGRGLYETEPVFRDIVDRCSDVLHGALDIDLRSVLYPAAGGAAAAAETLKQTAVTQPALFVIEYALARLLMSWGVTPAAMIGHSVGEFAAACVAGVFTLDDALDVLAERARLMQEQPLGGMLAVRLGEAEVLTLLDGRLSLAASNAPSLCVVSGPAPDIDAFARKLGERKVGAVALHTSHAFHSDMMDPILEAFSRKVGAVDRGPPRIPFISSCTGDWITAEQAVDPLYWAQQLRHPVRFSDGIRTLQQQASRVLLEVGPSRTLSTLAMQHNDAEPRPTVIAALGHARQERDDVGALLTAAGGLWLAGVRLNWTAFQGDGTRRRVPLPTYSFQRTRHWIEAAAADETAAASGVAAETAPAQPSPETGPGPAPELSRTERIAAVLKDVLHELSGIDTAQLDPGASFLEMGFDSLFLTQVNLAFQKRFGVKITLRMLLEELSTLDALAVHLDRELPDGALGAGAPAAPAAAKRPEPAFEPAATGSVPEAPRQFGPYKPYVKQADEGVSPDQERTVRELVERYSARTRKSKALTQAHRDHFADPRTVAGFQPLWKEITYPIVVVESDGCRLRDLDGNEYIDMTMGFGVCLFGHRPDFVTRALRAQLQRGFEIGPQSPIAGEVARRLCEFTQMDRATFCNTGSEAVLGALRSARTVTGRDRIAMFAGDYHGIHDEVLVRAGSGGKPFPIAPGIPREMVENVVVLEYGDPESLRRLEAQAGELAAVLVEPVQSRRPELQPREFLHGLRRITQASGTALVFDEVITGFRCHPRGAQAWFGVKADLATYGKVVGGGMPIGVIAGASRYMDAFDGGTWRFGDDSQPESGVTFFAGTFVRHPLAMAAAMAVMQHLAQAGPSLQRDLNARADRFACELNALFHELEAPLHIGHFSSMCYIHHDDSFKMFSLLFHHLRERGIHVWEGRPMFLSTAHTDEDVRRVVEAFRDSLEQMRGAGLLPAVPSAAPPAPPSRRAAGTEPREVPVIDAQREIWLTCQLGDLASCAFNESCSLFLRGPFDADAMRRAIRRTIGRHEALRTTFTPDGATQVVAPALDLDIPLTDLAELPAEERDRRVERFLRNEVRAAFDLVHGPLIRVHILRLAQDVHRIVLTAHHIVCDGWSYDVMVRDLSQSYSLECRGEPDARPLPMQISAYAEWVRDEQASDAYEADRQYWLQTHASLPEPLGLPTDRPRPPLRTFGGARETVPLNRDTYARVKTLASSRGCTLYATLFAAYGALLSRLTGQDDLVIAIPAAGQAMVGSHDLVGHCTNLLPIRVAVAADAPFADLLKCARNGVLEAYEHQRMTYGAMVETLNVPRDPSRTPLVSVMFNVDPAIHGMGFHELAFEFVSNPRCAFQFDFAFNLVASDDDLLVECDYNTDLFDAGTMRRWAAAYESLLEGACAEPGRPVDALPLLSGEERRTLLETWNRTASDIARDVCVQTLIERQTDRAPERTAITFAGTALTYGELDAEANRLANHLRRRGLEPGQRVGIHTERGPGMLAAVLAAWKAGAAYVPLDPGFPPERLQFMLQDSGAALLVTQERLASRLAWAPDRTVILDGEADAVLSSPATRPGIPVDGGRLAYVIYTSGSTGTPKGVQIEHRALVNFLEAMRRSPGMTEQDVVPAITTLSFDISGLELFLPLIAGARIVLVDHDTAADGMRLAALVEADGITCMQATPATWQMLIDAGWLGSSALRILCGGEAMSATLAGKLLSRGSAVWNLYGPTETTIWSTAHRVTSADGPIPIGRPIANTRIYILDGRMEPVPAGIAGELYIGGDGLARGYLNRPELTAERFVADPFAGEPGARLYRTGDLARYRPDGCIEFLGRSDFQVKLRGFRIELGEIESALAAHLAVTEAVAVTKTIGGSDHLVAYVVPARRGADGAAHVAGWEQQWNKLYRTGLDNLEARDLEHENIDAAIVRWANLDDAEAQVEEWIAESVKAVLNLRPKRVIEIGCGAGQLLFRIAPHCEEYVGTDFSGLALDELRLALEKTDLGTCRVELIRCEATACGDMDAGRFDTVVINSVVQYFPDAAYLWSVLDEALRLLKPGGVLFVGDVQSYRLLRAFHCADQLRHAGPEMPLDRFRQVVESRVGAENELVVDPELFFVFGKAHDEVAHVETRHRRGRFTNETTQFHYDAVLFKAPGPRVVDAGWIAWQEAGYTPDSLREHLHEAGPDAVCLRGIPNARVYAAVRLPTRLEDTEPGATVERLTAPEDRAPNTVHPMDLCALEDDVPYAVTLHWTETANDGAFDAVILRAESVPADRRVVRSPLETGADRGADLSRYTNDPAGREACRRLAETLRASLRESLPDYMVPTFFEFLPELPLTPNRKVDRNALPEPDVSLRAGPARRIAPRNETEKRLAAVWESVLGVQDVGVADNFFDLGGHSMTAVRMFVEVEKATGRNLPLATLFEAPTIERLAARLDRDTWAPSWPCLVPIRPEGDRPPFFCFHGAGGNVLLYRDLARHLGPDQPFYGVQAKGLDGRQPVNSSIETMAIDYIEEIRRLQPHGPYLLGGYCMGGSIAYEVARRLEAEGEPVGLVALFDTQSTWLEPTGTQRLRHAWERLAFHARNLALTRSEGRLAFLAEKTREAGRRMARRMDVTASAFAYRAGLRVARPPVIMETINDRAAANYRPRPYGGRIVVFAPKRQYAGLDADTLGWGPDLVKQVDIEALDVYPAGMLIEPFVAQLAAKLKPRLERAVAGS